MRRRRIGQLNLVDGLLRRGTVKRRDVLGEISALVDWDAIERLVDGIHRAGRGEPAYPPLAMVKVLLLQRWWSLSDPAMEEALADRLSFRRFAGFALDDETPDHSTIWRFREALGRSGLDRRLFEEVLEQLARHGMLVRQGTLVDASLVKSAARRPRMGESKESPVDPDARFGTTNERGRFEFGYKLHVATDHGSDLVCGLAVTPANVQDVSVAPELLPAASGTVYADRGYDAQRLRDLLAANGLDDGIMRRGRKGCPLASPEVERNFALAPIRRNVERLFGTMKRSYRLARMRVFGMTRVRVDLTFFVIAFNLKRWWRLATP